MTKQSWHGCRRLSLFFNLSLPEDEFITITRQSTLPVPTMLLASMVVRVIGYSI